MPAYESLNGHDHGWLKTTAEKALINASGADDLISFYPVVSTEDAPDDKNYPFSAIVGSLRYQLGSGTRTHASDRINGFDLAGQLEMSPQDSTDLNVQDGDVITVTSTSGSITRKVRIDRSLGPGHLFVPTGYHGNDAMRLLQLSDITKPGSPGWKTVSVKVEKVSSET